MFPLNAQADQMDIGFVAKLYFEIEFKKNRCYYVNGIKAIHYNKSYRIFQPLFSDKVELILIYIHIKQRYLHILFHYIFS